MNSVILLAGAILIIGFVLGWIAGGTVAKK